MSIHFPALSECLLDSSRALESCVAPVQDERSQLSITNSCLSQHHTHAQDAAAVFLESIDLWLVSALVHESV